MQERILFCCTSSVYRSLASLQRFISKKLSTNPKLKKPDLHSVEMGYVEPGHGMKGRKIWLHTDDDVKMMYVIERHDKKRSVMLWCYTGTIAQATGKIEHASKSSKSVKGGTKYGQHLENHSAVDEIYQQLQEKHKDYSPRRLRAWANMVHLKSWTSTDEPPNKPFFTKGRKQHYNDDKSNGESPVRKKLSLSVSSSPGRKIRVRSELIDQLDKFHKSGALSSTEYDELRSTILSDFKDL